MNLFDDVLIMCGKCIDTVVEKTGEVLDYSKAKLDKSSINVKLREKYQVLGKLCYDMSESGDDETGTMKKLIADIRSLKEDLRNIEEESEKAAKFKECRYCNAKNPQTASYCSKCGEKL